MFVVTHGFRPGLDLGNLESANDNVHTYTNMYVHLHVLVWRYLCVLLTTCLCDICGTRHQRRNSYLTMGSQSV